MSFLERQGTLHPEMAETITEHIPSLANSPSLDLDLDATQDSTDYLLDDAEFPYAREMIAGSKCCSKCGATKTPQWREGPFGPKTLCNACGVKRTRKLRAESDGVKRRKLTASPPSKGPSHYTAHKASHKALYAPQDPHPDSYASLDYDDGLPETYHYHPSPSLRRPTRRAAEEAAVKTARFARTGGFPEHAHQRHDTPTSSSDFSLPSSDCPEEVSWTPLAAEAAVRGGLPGMPLDCYAAVNLMTMAAADLTGSPASVAQARAPSAAGSIPDAAPLGPAAMQATLAKMDAPHGGRLTAADLLDLYKSLPPAKVAELVRLNEELDGSMQEAQGAGAAVAAVAAVLAAKQAAAIRARELAVSATKRLRRFMLELDTQFGVPVKSLPRIRTSPKKTSST